MDAPDNPMPWGCQVVCPHCETFCGIDWEAVIRPDGAGYDMRCPICRCPFNFTSWQYVSFCPGCGEEFAADMHAVVGEQSAHQWQCVGCNGLIEFKRNAAPWFYPARGGDGLAPAARTDRTRRRRGQPGHRRARSIPVQGGQS